jgi:hypothetical protein
MHSSLEPGSDRIVVTTAELYGKGEPSQQDAPTVAKNDFGPGQLLGPVGNNKYLITTRSETLAQNLTWEEIQALLSSLPRKA